MAEALMIGEIARRSGVAASALRFYEDKGLIASERADGGQRRFPRHVLRRIAFIVFAQRIGLSLDEIAAELAKLPRNRAPTGRDWERLSATWTSRIDARIEELERQLWKTATGRAIAPDPGFRRTYGFFDAAALWLAPRLVDRLPAGIRRPALNSAPWSLRGPS